MRRWPIFSEERLFIVLTGTVNKLSYSLDFGVLDAISRRWPTHVFQQHSISSSL